MRYFSVLILYFFSNSILFGFQDRLATSELYEKLIKANSTALSIENVTLVDDISPIMYEKDVNFFEALSIKLNFDFEFDSLGLKSKVERLVLKDIKGQVIVLEQINVDSIYVSTSSYQTILFNEVFVEDFYMDSTFVNNEFRLENSKIGRFGFYDNTIKSFSVTNNVFSDYFDTSSNKLSGNYWISTSKFKEGAYFSSDVDGAFIDFLLEGCEFEPIDSELAFPIDSVGDQQVIMKTQLRINFFGDVDQAYITENIFQGDESDQYVYLEGDYDYMYIVDNRFESILHPVATVIKQLGMYENEFTENLIFTEFILQGRNNQLNWSELEGFKLSASIPYGGQMSETPEAYGYTFDDSNTIFNQTSDILQTTYRAESDLELENLEAFQNLLSSYYRLYKTFKENGQISTANEVYIEMKDVQLKELAFNYRQNSGLESWIEWKLNTILRFYTDYGTRPAKAIRISVWVVAIFSIFYFFFPSEWDTKSKAQLISDYRAFIEKNDKGYFKPFLRLSFGFFKSLMNALTLSLNSFVTLGFGTIPTTGLARYVCILQGFLGWFLLSIFTASLINQVLF